MLTYFLWSPAGKGLCFFVTFPCGILGHLWYLIVSILDLCRNTYFDIKLEKERQCHITKHLVHSFSVNIRISQPSKVMLILALPR